MNEMNQEEVYELREKIRPLKKFDSDFFFVDVSKINPINQSFNFSDTPKIKKANVIFVKILRSARFPVTGYYGFFKPSEEEVLNIIPESLRNDIDCYWIDSKNLTSTSNITEDGQVQLADVWLFRNKEE